MAESEFVVYECMDCFQIIPYKSCCHNCPGLYNWDRMQEELDEGFQENLSGFYEEVRSLKENGVEINVVGVDGEQYKMKEAVLLAVSDQPGKVYRQSIILEDGVSYHLQGRTEDIPMEVDPIKMVEVSPGYYRGLTDMELIKLEMRMARINLDEEPNFEDIFQELREPLQ